METTVSGAVRLDFMAICARSVGTLQRRGVCRFVERDEMISVGCLALVEAQPETEALAVIVARRSMIDLVRRSERRTRGRVEVRAGHGSDVNGGEVADGDQWDAVIHGKQRLQPERCNPDLWEVLKALPVRQYQAVVLIFWAGLTEAAAAVEMGVNQSTVSRVIKEAKKTIGSCINSKVRAITYMRGKETQTGGPVGPSGGA